MRTRRTTELWLLIAATPVLLLLFAMYLVTDGTALTLMAFIVPISLIVAFFVTHLVLRKFAPGADPAILPIVFLLAGVGICFLLRLNPDEAGKQIIWLFLGIGLLIATVILVPSIDKLGRWKYTCLLFAIILLVLPMMPGIGAEYNGSRIWLSLGGFSFQPAEIAKILIVIFLAGYLADNREMLSVMRESRHGIKLPDLRTLLPLICMWVVALLIVIFEKDLGTALMFFGIFLVMLYVATGRLSYIIIGLVLTAIGAVGLYMIFSHVQTRVDIWLNPFSDPSGSGYQLVQSLYSLADGGLFGAGIGRGLCTLIPEVSSDFIFSAMGEELGLLGAGGVILLYLLFAIRGFLVAARAQSDVAAFTATGLTTSISLQAFIIVGGVTGLIPLTGVTLPFMSAGGSSMLSSFIIVGLLLVTSNQGTGLEKELTGSLSLSKESGVLGRAALGKRLTRLITFFAILFALLIANLTLVQVVRADEYQNMQGNNHTLQRQSQEERGAIVTSDDVVLAQSKEQSDGSYARVYPQNTLASQVVGYSSQRYGSSGIENTMSPTLVGEENFESFGDAIRSYAGESVSGSDVKLTIDSKIQQAAQDALKGEKGACVVLDSTTGAVLAEASAPTYDANDVASLLSGETSSADGALVNRATQSLYAPGSTFKTMTLGAALDTGTVTADSTYSSPSSIDIGNAGITNYHGSSHGTVTVREATAVSSNTVFAQIADQLGSKTLVDYSNKFGFGTSLSQDFATAPSLMPDPDEMTEWETAWAGVGQPVGEHTSPAGPQSTVMQMAVIMQTIANNGVRLKPYVVDSIISANGNTLATTSPQIAEQVLSGDTAKKEQDILKTVVESGTGTGAQISGATVMGKTGTAQTDKKTDDAWFVGTAIANGKSVTIAIVIEQGGSGGDVSAPKAGTVLATALERLGGLE